MTEEATDDTRGDDTQATRGHDAGFPAPSPHAGLVWTLAVCILAVLSAAVVAAWALPEERHREVAEPDRPDRPSLGAEQVTEHVVRVAGPDRTATSAAVSRTAFPARTDHAIVVTADDYPDALAAAALAGSVGGPVLLTSGTQLPDAVHHELAWLRPERVTIVGGKQAVSTAVVDELAELGVDHVRRVQGDHRFETAAQVAQQLSGSDRAYVVGDEGWPDAVAVSALAAHQDAPVLLTARDALPAATTAALREVGVDEVVVIGGHAAVAPEVEAELAEHDLEVSRIAGATRYATSRAVAELSTAAGLDAAAPWLVTGRDWPDALVAGAAAARDGRPLVLVEGADIDGSPTTQAWLADEPRATEATVVGGSAAIGEATVDDLTALAAGAGEEAVRVAAAGDIACEPGDPRHGSATACRHAQTAQRAGSADAVLVLGDLQYWNATMAHFLASYDPTWGQFKDRTVPAPGNHEYVNGDASDYYAYFGERAGPPGRGYHDTEIGTWQVLSLDSNCPLHDGCGPDSPQLEWLRDALETSDASCRLAVMHHPRFSDGTPHGDHPALEPMWQVLRDGGVDVVLAGHAHSYERFRRADPAGHADADDGMRSFVVGTGGLGLRPFGGSDPLSVTRTDEHFGVLSLELAESGYTWRFEAANEHGFTSGGHFTDRGFGSCH